MVNKIIEKISNIWKKTTKAIGLFISLIVLTLFYFLFLVPFGLVLKLFGYDPLEISSKKKDQKSNWQKIDSSNIDFESLKRQS